MLQARDLMVYYENMVALNDVSITCERGEVVGVFGANSAGKSTLMYALSGIILDIMRKERTRGGERITVLGEIRYAGEPIEELRASDRARRGLVLCPERRRLFAESSVLENLKIGGHLASRRQARETIDEVLDLFPALRPLLARPAGFLSGGEQQMLAIGRALMAQPRLLLLDEPLLGLAPGVQRIVVESIPRICARKKLSVIVTEQYAGPVVPHVDRGYVVENGSTVLQGSRAELLANPDVKAAYFGC
jgi:branched-chain amino acid transport system ATP-binding protein